MQRLVLGIFGLPLGLILVMLTGVELFTGNTMMMTFAVRALSRLPAAEPPQRNATLQLKTLAGGVAQVTQGLATPAQLVKNWVASFIGNFLGSVGIVALMGLTGLTIQNQAAAGVAVAKTSLTFTEVRWLWCRLLLLLLPQSNCSRTCRPCMQ